MTGDRPPLFTVGHSTHSLDAFINLLRRHEVTALADVRSSPWSRFNLQYNREALERELANRGVEYVFLGRELGARPEDRKAYVRNRVSYRRLVETAMFGEGIDRILSGALKHRIAIMCAEKEPLQCHRGILIAPVLVKRGAGVWHIHPDGRLESHGDAMKRLLHLTGLHHGDLFHNEREIEETALARQEARIAHKDKSDSPDKSESAT